MVWACGGLNLYQAGRWVCICVYIWEKLVFCSRFSTSRLFSHCLCYCFFTPFSSGFKRSLPISAQIHSSWNLREYAVIPSRSRARTNILSIKRNIRITAYNACNWIHTDKISTPNSMGWDGDLITRAPRLPGLESDWAHFEMTGKKCVCTCVFWQ